MTPEEMDQLFARHCAAEAAKDVEAILETLSDDVEHDVVGDPQGVLRDRGLIGKRYAEVFSGIEEDSIQPLRRYYGADFFVDDAMLNAKVTGSFLGFPGRNRPVSVRMLHVCEVRDGRISRENVWLDASAVVAQLGAPS